MPSTISRDNFQQAMQAW